MAEESTSGDASAQSAAARTEQPGTPAQAGPLGTAAPVGAASEPEAGPTEQPNTVPDPASSPFESEAAVLSEGISVRDDISATQATATATRDVSSSHMARLLYQPLGAPGGPVYQSQVLERRQRRT